MSWLGGWRYRRAITVTAGSNGMPANYQLRIVVDTASLISAGKMRSDGGDIRFTKADGVTLLSYWIESGINTANTIIWVKDPDALSANASHIIYMYYGNPNATSQSSGADTFDDFDDFLTDTLANYVQINSGWSIDTTPPGYLKSTFPGQGFIAKPKSLSRAYAVRARFYVATSHAGVGFIWGTAGGGESSVNGYIANYHPVTEYSRLRRYSSGSYTSLANLPTLDSGWYIMELRVTSSAIIAVRGTTQDASATDTTFSTLSGVGFRQMSGLTYAVDWWALRKYVDPEPSVTIGAENSLLTVSDSGTGAEYINMRKVALDSGSGIDRINMSKVALDSGSGIDRINMSKVALDSSFGVDSINMRKESLDLGVGAESVIIRLIQLDSGSGIDRINMSKVALDSSFGVDSINMRKESLDLGVGAEYINMRKEALDSGIGYDHFTSSLYRLVGDSGAGVEYVDMSKEAVDAGIGIESVDMIHEARDAGAGAEAVNMSKEALDSGAGFDAVNMTHEALDLGAGVEAVSMAKEALDSGSAIELVNMIHEALDSGSGVDMIISPRYNPLIDSGSGVETAAIQVPQNDAGAGIDTSTVTGIIPAFDSGSGIDVVAEMAKAVIDSGAGVEAVYISASVAAYDFGVGTDIIGIVARVSVEDFGAGVELADWFLSIYGMVLIDNDNVGYHSIPYKDWRQKNIPVQVHRRSVSDKVYMDGDEIGDVVVEWGDRVSDVVPGERTLIVTGVVELYD